MISAEPRPTVLVVDDDRMLARLAAAAIEKLGGCRVVVAESGAAGIELAERERPDLVLLDVWMEDMDGAAVLAALRARPSTASLAVAMLSGEEDPAVLARCAALGAVAVLKKPFDARALAARVRDLVSASRGGANG